MAKISTRDLILDVALVLLNERGESNVTSVDLAHEMNISPGNLYYHFKGKEAVVEELYAQFHARLLLALQEIAKQATGDPKHILAGLTVVSDLLQQFQFISQDIRGLHERYPSLSASLETLLSLLRKTLVALVSLMLEKAKVAESNRTARMLADNLMYTLLHYGGYDEMLDEAERNSGTIEEHLYLHFMPYV